MNGPLSQRVAARTELPGDLAIWFFIMAELLVFGLFFVSYAVTRRNNLELFGSYQATLDTRAGLLNTLLLVTSSWCVVKSVQAIRAEDHRRCARWLGAALGLGLAFVVVKLGEYAVHFGAGISLSTNSFYMFYLSLTGFHTMHVIMGMVILGFIAAKAWRGGYTREEHAGIETGAAYWHMVDLVWLFLFPLVYVMR